MNKAWKAWAGNRDFKGDALMRVRFRNGLVSKQVLPAHKWRGRNGSHGKGKKAFPDNYEFDIVEVQVQP